MGIIFYRFFLVLFAAGIRIAALFNAKAQKWVQGRKNIFTKLQAVNTGRQPLIWMHCASLGEFEQGRPLLEKLKEQYPGHKILLTFFSPSGYEIRKNYAGADGVFYLPMDSPRNAKHFLDTIQPSLIIFVKYEFWYFYLSQAKQRGIPLLLVSAIFRKGQPFFKWYGGLHREMLRCFTGIFLQDRHSDELLKSIGIRDAIVTGDTRFDRVATIAAAPVTTLPALAVFCGDNPVLVAGSSWPPDESLIQQALTTLPAIKLILAPHEIGTAHLEQVKKLFPEALSYSSLAQTSDAAIAAARVLIIDNIGLLSSLYRYATITYIGGGFGKGIHNTLEAAVYGKPVLFGPAYHKFREATDLVRAGAAFPVKDTIELGTTLGKLLKTEALATASAAAASYVAQQKGATEKITRSIQEKRLLTN